jgi:hypothetical protein
MALALYPLTHDVINISIIWFSYKTITLYVVSILTVLLDQEQKY